MTTNEENLLQEAFQQAQTHHTQGIELVESIFRMIALTPDLSTTDNPSNILKQVRSGTNSVTITIENKKLEQLRLNTIEKIQQFLEDLEPEKYLETVTQKINQMDTQYASVEDIIYDHSNFNQELTDHIYLDSEEYCSTSIIDNPESDSEIKQYKQKILKKFKEDTRKKSSDNAQIIIKFNHKKNFNLTIKPNKNANYGASAFNRRWEKITHALSSNALSILNQYNEQSGDKKHLCYIEGHNIEQKLSPMDEHGIKKFTSNSNYETVLSNMTLEELKPFIATFLASWSFADNPKAVLEKLPLKSDVLLLENQSVNINPAPIIIPEYLKQKLGG